MHTELPAREENAFDFLRVAAASSVLLSHSYALYGLKEPHLFAHRDSLGTIAVAVFFAISGYLVCQSLDRDPNVLRFSLRRGLRIIPGLVVAVLFTAFVIGPLATTLPVSAYLKSSETWSYFASNATLMVGASQLPGVFESNPVKGPNGSLWSLRHEVLMYGLLVLSGLSRHFQRMCLVLFATFASMWIVAALIGLPQVAQSLPSPWNVAIEVHAMRVIKLGALFFGASCLYLFRRGIPVSGIVASGLVAGLLLIPNTTVSAILQIVILPYATLAFALRTPVFLKQLVKHDISYGVYIYAFPVQQLVSGYFLARQLGWPLTLAVSGGLTVVLALLSWFFIERPALRLRTRLFARLSGGRAVATAPQPLPSVSLGDDPQHLSPPQKIGHQSQG